MKPTSRFLIAAVFVMTIYITTIQAQANLLFSGGNGTPLQITLQQSVVYTITNSNCVGVDRGPVFIIDEVGNLLSSSFRSVTGTITYSINGGTPLLIDRTQSGGTFNDVTVNDLYLYSFARPGVSSGDMVVLSAGTVITTDFNYAGTPPAGGSFTTFITNSDLARCSNNGVAMPASAASVSISGRVLTNSRRGLANAVVYLTDSEAKTRSSRTNSLGYYHFNDIEAGQSIAVSVVSKRYQFAPQVLNLNEEMSGVNFLAEQ